MKNIIILFIFAAFFSCQNNKKVTANHSKTSEQVSPGKKLMENKCYVCHNADANHNSRIAPPMVAVKNHYLSKGTTKAEFINSMQNWIKNPTPENVKMPGAVKRFGIMPKQVFPEETIKLIAEYIYENDIDKPRGFDENHMKKGQGKGMGNAMGKMQTNSNSNKLSYGEKGLEHALATKAVLGKNLMTKIQKEGTLTALKFCNIKAYQLTDSMSIVKNATIKRVSDKPRNMNNKASETEEEYIQIFKDNVKNGIDSKPIVVETSNIVNVYYPIKTNSMCLQCHGNATSKVKDNTLAAIKKLYPNDKALGYDINQVRGIWNVSFKK